MQRTGRPDWAVGPTLGREADVEAFLNQGLHLVGEEPKTVR